MPQGDSGTIPVSTGGAFEFMKFVINQDDREKTPLVFPAHMTILCPLSLPIDRRTQTIELVVEKMRLETGDYLLKGHEKVTLLERKGSLTEVAGNCLTREGRRKFVECCRRLRASCERPILMLEGSPAILRSPIRGLEDVPPGVPFDALYRLLREYGIELLLLPGTSLPQRQAMGEFVARVLVNSALTRRLPDDPTGLLDSS